MRDVAKLLAIEGYAPHRFAQLRYVHWSGNTKDLSYVSSRMGEHLFLDDYSPYVHPGREHLRAKILLSESPYSPEDKGFKLAYRRLLERITELSGSGEANDSCKAQ